MDPTLPKHRKSRYFFTRILTTTLGVVLPVIAVLAYVEYRQVREQAALVKHLGVSHAQEAARSADDALRRLDTLMNVLLLRDEIRDPDPARCGALLEGFYSFNLLLRNVEVLDNQGVVRCSARSAPARQDSVTDTSWWQQARQEGKRTFGKPHRTIDGNHPAIVLTDVIHSSTGVPAGLLAVTLDLDKFSHEILRVEGMPQGSVLSLVGPDGILLGRTPDLDTYFNLSVSNDVLEQQGLPEGVTVYRGVDGVERAHSIVELRTQPWQVYVGVPVETLRAAVRLNINTALMVLVFTLLVSVLTALWNAQRLARPVQQLAQAVKRLSQGDQAVRADSELPGEFGPLAAEFNALVDNLSMSRALEHAATERFQRIFEALPVPAALYPLESGALAQVNDAFCASYGVPREQLLGRRLQELDLGLVPEDFERYREAMRGDGSIRGLEAVVRIRGGVRHVLTSAVRVDLQGELHVLSVHVDIGDRLRAEQALREREQQLAGILASANDGIVTVDSQQKVVVCNDAAARLFDVPVDQALAGPPERLLPAEALAIVREALAEPRGRIGPIAEGPAFRRMTARRAGGQEFPVEAAFSRAGAGSRTTVTVILRDVTELEQGREALLENERMQAASRAKTEFLSRMSHELRTPLNAVLGFTKLLRESTRETLAESQKRHLELVENAGQQLGALIDDVLDLSRIEAGQLAVTMGPVALCDVLNDAVSMSEAHAQSSGVHLVRSFDCSAALAVRTDSIRLQQVLMNIISNAIKYNRPDGEVRIEVTEEPEAVRIVIADTGLGMSPEQLMRAFEPFNRLGRERSGVPGTGIGLALTKQLVELLEGRIVMTSQEGVGTTATLTLPRSAEAPRPGLSPEDPAPSLDDVTGPSGTVLYVEDIPLNAFLVEKLLSRWPKVRLVVAEDGSTGLRLARELRPDVILLDMQLPDMPGLQVLAALRADPDTTGVPVVALSANAMPEEVAAAKAAGAVDYWTKPIKFNTFHEGIRRWLSAREPEGPSSEAGAPTPSASATE